MTSIPNSLLKARNGPIPSDLVGLPEGGQGRGELGSGYRQPELQDGVGIDSSHFDRKPE